MHLHSKFYFHIHFKLSLAIDVNLICNITQLYRFVRTEGTREVFLGIIELHFDVKRNSCACIGDFPRCVACSINIVIEVRILLQLLLLQLSIIKERVHIFR